MPRALNRTRQERLLAAIPIDKICRACAHPNINTDNWRLTIFGDAVCLSCYKKEREQYPDLYNDPLTRTKLYNFADESNQVELWQTAVHKLRQSRKERRSRAELPLGVQCAHCPRVARKESKRQEWVNVQGTWICRSCYTQHINDKFRPGVYCEDKHGRVFQVTKDRRARYPFGVVKLHRRESRVVESYAAASLLYDIQREQMFNLVTQHEKQIKQLAKTLSLKSGADKLDVDSAYDLVLNAAMRAAGLYNSSQGQFVSYLNKCAYNAFNKYANNAKRQPSIIATDNYDTLDSAVVSDIQLAERIELAELQDSKLTDYWQAVVDEIGTEDWYIFVSWIVSNRSQIEIGRELGVISQTIGMRIKKVIATCKRLEYILH